MSVKYLIIISCVFASVNAKCLEDDEVIKKLLEDYQSQVPPPKTVDDEVALWLAEAEKLCAKSSSLTLNIYLNQIWVDPRLNFEKLDPCKLTVVLQKLILKFQKVA